MEERRALRSKSLLHAVALAVFSLTLVSWPEIPRARAGQLGPVGAARHMQSARIFEPVDAPRLTSFVVRSVNTGESVTVLMKDDVPEPESERELAHLLRCLRTHKEHAIDPRLVVALSRIAAATGGEIELVSGYRAPKHGRDHNFHTQGMAADIRVSGVRTWDLRRLADAQGVPGVGFYPTSKMIHVDVRDVPYRWTDWSGPSR
jgi:uncharacterized protein YcbK (DUF882 family)